MNIITLDFETYLDKDYTLKKLSVEEYVRDERFEVLGVGIRWANGNMDWLHGNELNLPQVHNELAVSAVLCHHAQFDGLILNHIFNIKPKVWLDTYSMARQVHGLHTSSSLDSLSKLYGLAGKTLDYKAFLGKHWSDLTSEEQNELANGCLQDVSLTYSIFKQMLPTFPKEELRLIDLTIRMFTEPVLQANVDLLREIWTSERDKKTNILRELGVTKEDLGSPESFAALLRAEGVEPSFKVSGTGNNIYSFAKTDDFMRDLQEHENDRVRTLAEARLNVKSTINQTRAASLGAAFARGSLPVYLNYNGAQTTRWSGGDGLNWQNFNRGGSLRRAVLAPDGYAIAVADLSQIECRLLFWLAGEESALETFRNGGDIYCEMAGAIYGFNVTKEDNPNERGTGKQAILSCGYGSGPEKFQATARLGIYGPPVILSSEEASRAVQTYRQTYRGVAGVDGLWRRATNFIEILASDSEEEIEWGPMVIRKKRIYLPNGSCLIYDSLKWDYEFKEFRHMPDHKGWKKLYGARLCQNVCEGLGRLIIGQAFIRLKDRGYPVRITKHDDGAFLVKEHSELNVILEEFRRDVSWAPGLPIGAEGHVGKEWE